jgi:archaemetzincin
LKSPRIYVVPIELADADVINPLLSILPGIFDLPVAIHTKRIALDLSYDNHRNQYYSSIILTQLIENPPADALRILGIINVDIFMPIMTYLYGEAQLKGLGALISLYRLRNKSRQEPPNRNLFQQRMITEAIHELGHTYGLVHCHHPDCVMRSSTCIEDVDDMSFNFCKSCQEIVKMNSPPWCLRFMYD